MTDTDMLTLFVDDDPEILSMWGDQCKDAGIKAAFARTRDDAIAIILGERVCHLICDGNIPVRAGGIPAGRHGLAVLEVAKRAGVPERWIVSGNDILCRRAVKDSLATLACAKVLAVEKALKERNR